MLEPSLPVMARGPSYFRGEGRGCAQGGGRHAGAEGRSPACHHAAPRPWSEKRNR